MFLHLFRQPCLGGDAADDTGRRTPDDVDATHATADVHDDRDRDDRGSADRRTSLVVRGIAALLLVAALSACGGAPATDLYDGDLGDLQSFRDAYNDAYGGSINLGDADVVARNICTYAARNPDAESALDDFASDEDDPESGEPSHAFLAPAYNAAIAFSCPEFEDKSAAASFPESAYSRSGWNAGSSVIP